MIRQTQRCDASDDDKVGDVFKYDHGCGIVAYYEILGFIGIDSSDKDVTKMMKTVEEVKNCPNVSMVKSIIAERKLH